MPQAVDRMQSGESFRVCNFVQNAAPASIFKGVNAKQKRLLRL